MYFREWLQVIQKCEVVSYPALDNEDEEDLNGKESHEAIYMFEQCLCWLLA